MTWVASYNANRDEVFADYAMEIPGRSVAAAYLGEFNQMWGSAGRQPRPESARFHTGKTDRLATHDVLVNGNPARVYFSPQTPVVDTIAALARRVEREAAFAVFAFTRDDLADELIAARDRGAAVGGLLDRASAGDTASVYRQLRNAHIPVRVDSSLTVHEKLLVADSSFAVTGSANWSNNANNANDENTLIITDRTLVERLHAEVVRRYVAAGGTWPPGVEETEDDESRRAALEATICRGVLCLPPSALTSRASLFDPTGRAVARLHPGPNDIRHLTPGVYLVLSIGGEPSAVEVGRVVVTR
jgi:phosphatidylserine/phosphatidylglycerophosphate/cardiolipin synthase-like enzyme